MSQAYTAAKTKNVIMNPFEWGLLLSLSILWGGSFFFVGVAVQELPPLTIVFLRVGIAALALNLVMNVTGTALPRSATLWFAFLGMALLNNVIPFTLIVWGQTSIASGLAAILNATTPLFTVFVAHFFTSDERATPVRWIGVAIGFVGVVLMIGPKTMEGLSDNLLAQLACLGGAISYAFAGVYGRRFSRMGVAPLATATGQVTVSTALLLPIVLIVEKPWTLGLPSFAAFSSIAALAIFSTALAYILYFKILATAGATNLLLVTFLIPVTAILLGSAILGETLEMTHFMGMGLIGLGLLAIDGRILPKKKPLRKGEPEWRV